MTVTEQKRRIGEIQCVSDWNCVPSVRDSAGPLACHGPRRWILGDPTRDGTRAMSLTPRAAQRTSTAPQPHLEPHASTPSTAGEDWPVP
jgi:hypothetical protein